MCGFRTCPLFEFLTTFARDEMRERDKVKSSPNHGEKFKQFIKILCQKFCVARQSFFSGFYSRFILIYSCKYMHV